MNSVNKVMLIGNLTRDPELRYTPQGAAVCELSVALNRSYTKKDTEQRVEEVVYAGVTIWGRLAENCAQFLKKGRQVWVEGRLSQSRWDDQASGQKRSKTFVTAEAIVFLGGGRGNSDTAPAPEIVDETPRASGTDEAPEDIPF